ncbi:hypothetical protein U703_14735 [Rhodobacter capsulatus YW1]|nr:hypothetical protein U703_14735 [Rhodobacter capsulatus YW1]
MTGRQADPAAFLKGGNRAGGRKHPRGLAAETGPGR